MSCRGSVHCPAVLPLCLLHTCTYRGCLRQHLMLIRQVAEPLHEINRLFLRAAKGKVAGLDYNISGWESCQLIVQTMNVGDMEDGHCLL